MRKVFMHLVQCMCKTNSVLKELYEFVWLKNSNALCDVLLACLNACNAAFGAPC